MAKGPFELEHDYRNVYFLIIDAKGHSDVVRLNDEDKVDSVFDAFESRIYSAVDETKRRKRCEQAEFWGWQGDGGLCVVYDHDESVARETAVSSVQEILADVPSLSDKFRRDGIIGELHVRAAVHKGSFRFKGDDKRGSIHSKELNLISHLEKVVPVDSLAITKEVYDKMGGKQSDFLEVGAFEDTRVYVQSRRQKEEVLGEWKRNMSTVQGSSLEMETDVPLDQLGLTGVFSQRALTSEYVRLIEGAKKCLWVLGIGLGGFQSDHREIVLKRKGLEGLDIRLLVADPGVSVTVDGQTYSLPSWRDRDVGGRDQNVMNLRNLMKIIEQVNRQIRDESNRPNKKYVQLRYSRVASTPALMRVDSVVYISPYFVRQQGLKTCTFKFTEGGRLYRQCVEHFQSIWGDDAYSREATDVFQGK